jgi:nicotinamide mononucleotide adenylyltransferase
MDAVGDTARRNGMPPGILRGAGDRAAELETPLTADERRDMIKKRARDLALDLEQTRGIQQASYAQAQSQGITLSQPAANAGGNMTTNMLQGLDSRAQALQSAIGEVEDQARQQGIAPGLLR